jgi:hypothetical protein
VDRSRKSERPFIDLTDRVSAKGIEEGLLSIAFAPDYATSGRFYVDYTDADHATIVEEYRRSRDPDVADPRTARRVLVIPNATENHHGGLVLFGPDDLLYIGHGIGVSTSDVTFPAQRLDELHGKILRIDPREQGNRPYRIPPDNPFVGRPGRDEIWAYGLRNPWRFGFDPESRALMIGDVGSQSTEEIDVATSGGLNFGWACYEGSGPGPQDPSACTDTVGPVIEHFRGVTPVMERDDVAPRIRRGRPLLDVRLEPGEPVCSVIAGVSVQDPELTGLRGRYLYGDFCDPTLRSFRLDGGRAIDQSSLGLEVPVLSSFDTDSAGHVYVTSLAGPVYRLTPAR